MVSFYFLGFFSFSVEHLQPIALALCAALGVGQQYILVIVISLLVKLLEFSFVLGCLEFHRNSPRMGYCISPGGFEWPIEDSPFPGSEGDPGSGAGSGFQICHVLDH